jgi:hypothetical protein
MNVLWKKRARLVLTFIVAYTVLHWFFAQTSEGLMTPTETALTWPLVLGVSTLALRLVGLFWLLPVCAYWIVLELVRQLTKTRQ